MNWLKDHGDEATWSEDDSGDEGMMYYWPWQHFKIEMCVPYIIYIQPCNCEIVPLEYDDRIIGNDMERNENGPNSNMGYTLSTYTKI